MKRKQRQGFTMIELSLSMVFIGILSLALTYIIANTLVAYRRGLTLNRVNEIGQAIVDDVRSAVQNSSNQSVLELCTTYYLKDPNDITQQQKCLEDGARAFVYLEKEAGVELGGTSIGTMPVYGLFCAGTYSFLWASGYYYTSGAKIDGVDARVARPKYNLNDFRLLKIQDPDRALCKTYAREYTAGTIGSGNYSSTYKTASAISSSLDKNFGALNGYALPTDGTADELLSKTDAADLVLYTFDLNNPAESVTEGNSFYSGSFILGTVDGGINIMTSGKTCASPAEYTVENFDYCAINKFSFAAQTGGSRFKND